MRTQGHFEDDESSSFWDSKPKTTVIVKQPKGRRATKAYPSEESQHFVNTRLQSSVQDVDMGNLSILSGVKNLSIRPKPPNCTDNGCSFNFDVSNCGCNTNHFNEFEIFDGHCGLKLFTGNLTCNIIGALFDSPTYIIQDCDSNEVALRIKLERISELHNGYYKSIKYQSYLFHKAVITLCNRNIITVIGTCEFKNDNEDKFLPTLTLKSDLKPAEFKIRSKNYRPSFPEADFFVYSTPNSSQPEEMIAMISKLVPKINAGHVFPEYESIRLYFPAYMDILSRVLILASSILINHDLLCHK